MAGIMDLMKVSYQFIAFVNGCFLISDKSAKYFFLHSDVKTTEYV